MNTDIPMAVPTAGNVGVIAFDLKCTSCGYNLRGLHEGGVCPECANPIERSLRGDLLQFADPAWLRQLHTGVRMMLWYVVINVLLALLGVITGATGMPIGLVTIPALAASVFYVIAVFLLTIQEPRDSGVVESVTVRNAIRVSVVLSCMGSFVEFVGPMLNAGSVSDVMATILQMTGLVAMVGIFVYLRRFALRIPDGKLAQTTRTVMWGLVVSLSLVLLMALIAGAAGGALATPGAAASSGFLIAVLGSLGCIGGLGAIVFGIWNIRLLFRYRDAFKLAAEQSASDLAARKHADGITVGI